MESSLLGQMLKKTLPPKTLSAGELQSCMFAITDYYYRTRAEKGPQGAPDDQKATGIGKDKEKEGGRRNDHVVARKLASQFVRDLLSALSEDYLKRVEEGAFIAVRRVPKEYRNPESFLIEVV